MCVILTMNLTNSLPVTLLYKKIATKLSGLKQWLPKNLGPRFETIVERYNHFDSIL